MLNKQIPIKQDLTLVDSLAINSIFYTIQGEGVFAGSPSVFVRLSGCNLQCPSCDTEYTESRRMSTDLIIYQIGDSFPREHTFPLKPLVVITGGEPFRQNIARLVNVLLDNGYRVQIETNGTLFVDLQWAFAHKDLTVICSPKAGKVSQHLLPHIDAFKYVIHADSVDPDDGLPILALDHTASPRVARPPFNFHGEIFIQPIDVQDDAENKRHLNAAVASSLKYGYRLCLQMHKIIGVA